MTGRVGSGHGSKILTRFHLCLTTVCIAAATAINSLGHGLHAHTAVPMSTQPSALRGTFNFRA